MSRVVAGESRYELVVDGDPVGLIDFADDGVVVELTHTEVDPAHRNEGLGEELVQGALDDLRAKGRNVRPTCRFVAAFIRRHPDYANLVSED